MHAWRQIRSEVSVKGEDAPEPPIKREKKNRIFIGLVAVMTLIIGIGIFMYFLNSQNSVPKLQTAQMESKMGQLEIHTFPETAKIEVLKIDASFQQGMELAPGRYQIRVCAEGYESKQLWHSVTAGPNQLLEIRLVSLPEPASTGTATKKKRITSDLGMKFFCFKSTSSGVNKTVVFFTFGAALKINRFIGKTALNKFVKISV
jgi:hypothetical protein